MDRLFSKAAGFILTRIADARGTIVTRLALFAVSALLSSFRPFEGSAPFGFAIAIAARYSGSYPMCACLGALIGSIVSGGYIDAAACAAVGAAIFLEMRYLDAQKPFRILIAYSAELITLTVLTYAFRGRVLYAAAASTVSVFGAVVLGHALSALRSLFAGRRLDDTELITLAAFMGLITLSMGSFNIKGVSPGVIFAGAVSLFGAYRLGVPALAAAVTAGAGRALISGVDLHFIAVLAAASLLAASLRGVSKWASLGGFALVSAILRAVFGSVGTFSYFETGAVCLLFALVPERLYMKEPPCRERTGESASSYSRLQLKNASLSQVLSELARVYGPDEGKLLECISSTLKRQITMKAPAPPLFETEYGFASGAKEGSSRSGDSFAARDIDGKLLLALSDGMGSGSAASEESRSALALLSDLLFVGFGVDDAAECVNALLSRNNPGDMYATLDVMLIDLENGTASLKKYGAPTSYMLRGDRLFAICGEALPIGIIESARGDGRSIRLRSGDTLIMMSDGVSDALGSGLVEAIADNVLSWGDPDMAANSLLEAAKKSGGADDMTVVVCRVESRGKAA
jgi:serine phosphatase RsbU (regulator of sigma subunit)